MPTLESFSSSSFFSRGGQRWQQENGPAVGFLSLDGGGRKCAIHKLLHEESQREKEVISFCGNGDAFAPPMHCKLDFSESYPLLFSNIFMKFFDLSICFLTSPTDLFTKLGLQDPPTHDVPGRCQIS